MSTNRQSRFVVAEATRAGQYARVALDGPSGSGKTYTALEWAQVLDDGKGTLGIDTERGEMGLYAHLFPQADGRPWKHLRWTPPYDPRELRDELLARAEGYSTIIIDSGSHFWMGEGGTLEIVDNAGRRDFGGNRFAGWQEGTPAQRDLVDALTSVPCHIIWTMRSKMAYVLDQDNRPQKVGMAPIQRDGMEYEFTVIAEADLAHRLTITKTRCDLLDGRTYPKGHSREMMETLLGWLKDAEPIASPAQLEHLRALTAAMPTPDLRDECRRQFKASFGEPRFLTVGRLEEAETFIRGFAALHAGQEGGLAPDGLPHEPEFHDNNGDEDDEPEEFDGEERVAAKAAEMAQGPKGDPGPKRTRTRKPKAAGGSSASGQPDAGPGEAPAAAGDDGGPEPEAPASGAPGASEGIAPASGPEGGRSWLTQQVLKSPAKVVDAIRETLDDAELWPVDTIEDERVAEAIALVACVVDMETKAKA